jgi:hypothetical protein
MRILIDYTILYPAIVLFGHPCLYPSLYSPIAVFTPLYPNGPLIQGIERIHDMQTGGGKSRSQSP